MKTLSALFCALLLSASSTMAGEVFGTISEGAKPIAKGVKIEITASGKVYSAETDKFGSYRIFVKEKGKCTLVLHLKDQSPSAEIFSYDRSTRYDWILETKEAGSSLRRK